MPNSKDPTHHAELASLKEVCRLYTNDFSSEELGRLPGETRDAYRLFTSQLDRRRWHEMKPGERGVAIFKSFFLGLTLRMSPLRRFLYLLALVTFAGGFFHWSYLLASFLLLNFVLILEIADKLFLKGDLQIAREIQTGLLPTGQFRLGDTIEVHASSTPANTVGGDYFDFLRLGEHRTGIAVGDVSGKGIPAALLMAYLQASFRALSSVQEFDLSELMSRVNEHIFKNTPSNRLITLFYCILDRERGSLHYCNAGHNHPLWFNRDGEVYSLQAGGLPLGIQPEARYECGDIQVRPGETLVLYTDGITEAANTSGEEFGEQRLQGVLRSHLHQPPVALADNLMRSIRSFVGSNRYQDDLTLVIVRF